MAVLAATVCDAVAAHPWLIRSMLDGPSLKMLRFAPVDFRRRKSNQSPVGYLP